MRRSAEGKLRPVLDKSAAAVSYMVEEITHICRDLGKREPGSEGEAQAARYLAEVLERDCGCSRVRIEGFSEHPSAFYGYFRFSMCFDLLCGLSFFLRPWLSLLFGGCALLLFLVQFVLYRQLIDPLFPKKRGTNVTAIRPCAGEARRRVLLNGHMDAAWEFPLNYRFGGVVFEIPGVMALVGVLFYMALALCQLCGAGGWVRTAALWGLLFLPFFVLVGFTYDPKRIVDGANDDLTGCYMGIALLREMEAQGINLEHTELGVLLTGSEEAGLRGAKAWCRAHREDFRDIPTYVITFDTIHDPKYLQVNARDLNGTVRADPGLTEAFLRAAERAGAPCRRGMVPLFGGSTDSAAFTQGGLRSVGVTGLNHKLEDYYHTRKDSWDNLNRAGLENCFRATVMLLEELDSGERDGA